MSWREKVDRIIREHLEKQIKESSKHEESYSDAGNKANAQLWIAIANLSKRINDLSMKIKNLEGKKTKVKEKLKKF